MKRRRVLQALAGGAWALLVPVGAVMWWLSGLSVEDAPLLLASWLENVGLVGALLVFVVLYAIRPLFLFPSSVMGITAGLTFGPILGYPLVLGGELLGASLAFQLSRLLGRRWIETHESPKLARWDARLQRDGLSTVTVLRLLWLPFDTISYACGLTGVRYPHFVLGTMLGGSCYFLSVAFLGGAAAAGLDGAVSFAGYELSYRAITLGLSAASFAVGLVLAWSLRRRFSDAGPVAPEPVAGDIEETLPEPRSPFVSREADFVPARSDG